jgi:hypothetical protein
MPVLTYSPLTFEFFARYVIAGFIIFLIRNAFVVGERPKLGDISLDVVLFGLVNQLVWQFIVWVSGGFASMAKALSTSPQAFTGLKLDDNLIFYLEVLFLPIAIGLVSGKLLRNGWQSVALRTLSMPIVDPIPRAYDHVFSMRSEGFVIVTYKDGTQIFGYYGSDSRAGRDPNRSELYLERMYEPGKDDGQWKEVKPPRSVLLSLSELRSIEFIE